MNLPLPLFFVLPILFIGIIIFLKIFELIWDFIDDNKNRKYSILESNIIKLFGYTKHIKNGIHGFLDKENIFCYRVDLFGDCVSIFLVSIAIIPIFQLVIWFPYFFLFLSLFIEIIFLSRFTRRLYKKFNNHMEKYHE